MDEKMLDAKMLESNRPLMYIDETVNLSEKCGDCGSEFVISGQSTLMLELLKEWRKEHRTYHIAVRD